jgi:hypothetical protein
MRSYLHLLTVACVSASAGLFVASTYGDTTTVEQSTVTTPVGSMDNAALPDGIIAKNENADKAVEKTFKGVAEDALSKNGFKSVVGYLAPQDYERIKNSTSKGLNNVDGNDNKALNDIVVSLGDAWKAKYNVSFSIDYKAAYPGNISVMTGEVSDPNALIGKWPVGIIANANTAGTVTPSDAQTALNKTFGGDVKLEKGREVAIAHFAGNNGNGTTGLTASLIHEHLTGWRFDIPNTIDADRLYNNLVNNLSYLNNNRNAWPADVNQAQVTVTHAVIAALYDVDLSQNHSPTAMNQ